MTLIRTSLLNGIAVIIKMCTLLGINKVLAIYVGPSGYAALGQFQNAVQMITTFASGAINTGVTKYTAEYYDDSSKQHSVWRTAGSIALIGSIVSSIIIAFFSDYLARLFFKDVNNASVFRWFAVTLVFFTFNALLLAILNGKKEVIRFVIANIAGSIFALLITTLMSIYLGLYGALVALAIYQSLSFFVTLYVCINAPWFKLSFLWGHIDKKVAENLFKYTAMALTSAACVPVSQIFVRNHLGEVYGWSAAGYWEAMSRLSSAYLLLITSTLSVYYLPRLSELKETDRIKKEIRDGYKVILPCTIVFGVLIYLLRDFIIKVLFTSDFLPMRELFAWQMIGDTLKIGSWILAYLMLGKAMFKMFMITELFFSATFVLLVYLFTSIFGFTGVTIAYAVNYAAYWLIVALLISKELKSRPVFY